MASVYPRWRGEHAILININTCSIRFIPAGAGNTLTSYSVGLRTTVYPRWRGEHAIISSSRAIRRGLSPLARGTLANTGQEMNETRFIPAGAGNTVRAVYGKRHRSVYPRWRGEHAKPKTTHAVPIGLSPLARGTRGCSQPIRGRYRFIPAGAGNTVIPDTTGLPSTVYPRWRGEHTKRISLFINYFLSAPHSTNIIATI